jgi:hypothetical protein
MPDNFLTCAEIAAILHVSTSMVRARARERNVGVNIYPGGPRIFTPEDVDKMRPGPKGHWPKGRSRKPAEESDAQ